jgi:hypothetical protein
VVLHLVASPAVVVVEEEVAFEAQDAGQRWVPSTRGQVTVFEVVNGQIGHVVDIWQPH